MGYYMQQTDSLFTIKAENKAKALEAIKALAERVDTDGSGGSSTGERWYSWVTTSEFVEAESLKEAVKAWRWNLDMDDVGNVYGICFEGEKLGDDEILFRAIAPYVEEGSFIQMSGEDGCLWRWSFDGKECIEKSAQIEWV